MSTIKGDHIITRIPSSKYTLKWSIEKFPKLLCGKTVTSPVFRPISGTEWVSTLEKNSTGTEWDSTLEKNSTSVTWKIYNKSKSNVHVQHDITVLDYKGKILFKKSLSREYTKQNNCCIVIENLDKTLLDDSEHVITFVCHMTLTGKEIKSEITEYQPTVQDSVHNLKKLSDDLKTLYGISLYTDVSLKVEGTVLRAHRAILCARSPVFAKMFAHALNEKVTNEINITDVETGVLKQLISFLYTGIVRDESYDSVFTLYYAADKYDVTDLRQRLSDILMANITVDNACRVLALADRHSDYSFKKSAMEFVETYLEPILATEGWNQLLKEEAVLATEVMNVYTEKRKVKKETESVENDDEEENLAPAPPIGISSTRNVAPAPPIHLSPIYVDRAPGM